MGNSIWPNAHGEGPRMITSDRAARWIARDPMKRLHGLRVTSYSIAPEEVVDRREMLSMTIYNKFYSGGMDSK